MYIKVAIEYLMFLCAAKSFEITNVCASLERLLNANTVMLAGDNGGSS
jgi:hypothetical protein